MARSRSETERCERCRLRCDLCMCSLLRPLGNRTRVTVLMHTAERWRTSNSVHLLKAALVGCEVRIVGDREVPFDGLGPARPGATRLLLFPDRAADGPLPTGDLELIVPDGSWSQARRMTRRIPDLARLPRVALPDAGPSVYGLRRNQLAGGLCTAEAVAVALGRLETPALEASLRPLVAEFSRRALWARTHQSPMPAR